MSHPVTQPPPARARFELLVYTREGAQVFELTPGSTTTIGRSTTATIQIDDNSVSRQHARLYVGQEVEVEDLGSSNGTTLVRNESGEDEHATGSANNRLNPGERVPLHPGDVLRAGTVILVLQLRGRSPSTFPQAPEASGPIMVDPEMRRAHDLVKRAAATEISVLILGETGVGKELMAETVHRYSVRTNGPFLKLNCAALTDSLLESELFGHERGAFTGAHAAKPGLLESTDGGTVFLDEIGELPLGTQAKLLRVLEERCVIRVGATKPRKIDVRFVTATNRDLAQRVRGGMFRSDLYYRISGLVVRIPPLRQRPLDIEPLALHFLRQLSARTGHGEPRLTNQALARLAAHPWPGNVRELRNVMERASLLASGDLVGAEHILLESSHGETDLMDAEFDADTAVFQPPPGPPPPPAPGEEEVDERTRILRALEACGGNQTRAARMLGVSRRTLINRLEQFNLPRPKKPAG
jgi:two-component system response regulator AtoC